VRAGALGRPFRRIQELCAAAQCVGRVHGEGILHLDLKPSHIVTDNQGNTYVLDWESARPWNHPRDRSFGFCGSPHYMAPEQAFGSCGLFCPATDVFSFGVILWEVLHRQRLRPLGESLAQSLRRAQFPNTRCETQVQARFPNLTRICQTATALHPNDRFRDATELARVLRQGAQIDCGINVCGN